VPANAIVRLLNPGERARLRRKIERADAETGPGAIGEAAGRCET
jgi:hypothetical protein